MASSLVDFIVLSITLKQTSVVIILLSNCLISTTRNYNEQMSFIVWRIFSLGCTCTLCCVKSKQKNILDYADMAKINIQGVKNS